MAVFEYKAMDLDAGVAVGTIIADTPRQARDELRERGLTITAIAAAEETDARPTGRLKSQTEVAAFIRELATLLATGIPLLSALGTLGKQHRGSFKTVVQHLADQIAGGSSLADAMGRHPAYFDEITANVVAVGESTGSLDVALRRLAGFKEKAHHLRNRVVTALLYPAIVLVLGLAVTIFLMTYVVPQLVDTLAESGQSLPTITSAVKAVSDVLVGWWWLIVLIVFGGAAGVVAAGRHERSRYWLDRFVLAVPLVGELIRKETTSRMAVVLAALLRSDLAFVEAVEITRRTVANRVFRRALEDYERAVAAGRDVAGPLAESGVFSPMVIQMLSVGQETGQLEEMLDHLAGTYDRQVDTAVTRLTAVLEPILIVLLAIMVGFVALATILPILESTNVM
jgi:type II secretory pathway component PulF